MISKKAVNFLKAVVLPVALYLILFNPLFGKQDQNINIKVGSALLSILISSAQLAVTIFLMVKFHKISLADTGLFTFKAKTLLKLIPSMLIVWCIYFAGLLAMLLITGSAEDPAIITIELHAPVWLLCLMMLFIGYCEEFFFRIYLVETIETELGKKAAILISALLFALGHLYQGFLAVSIIFFIGLGFQWIYERYRSLHVNAITHAVFDVISVMVKT